MKKIVINGRGLGKPINGIPRYLKESITEIDSDLDQTSDISIEVVIPEKENAKIQLRNIKVIKLKESPLWDYIEAEKYARKEKALYINMSSKGVLYRNSIATIHDIRDLRWKEDTESWNSFKIKERERVSWRLAVSNAKRLVTVSEFSKREICEYYHYNPDKVDVIGNGWEHIKNIIPDYSIFDEFKEINRKNYYFFIGSIAPHKNLRWMVENKKKHPEYQFVVMGKIDDFVWGDRSEELENLIYVGYQSDERMVALLKNAKALVFPSLYEGFGIPPLEALACGCPAIVSDIPVMREVFGETVHYINPIDSNVDLNKILNEPVSNKDYVLKNYSWRETGKRWIKLFEIYG